MSNKPPVVRPGLVTFTVDSWGNNSLIGTYVSYSKKDMISTRVTIHFDIKGGPSNIASLVKEELEWLRVNCNLRDLAAYRDGKLIAKTA